MAIKSLFPKLRFNNGWEPLHCPIKREPDSRSVEELADTIGCWARRIPVVKEYLPQIEQMNPKHFSLVADTVELSQTPASTYADVDLLKPLEVGEYSPLEKMLRSFLYLSKENPDAIKLSEEVINNTDKYTSKFYLNDAATLNFLSDTRVADHFEKTIPEVETIADYALRKGSSKESQRQQNFMSLILTMLNPKADVEKFKFLKPIIEASRGTCYAYDLEEVVLSKVPNKTIAKNLETLSFEMGKNYSYGKTTDVAKYLTRE